MMKSIRTIFVGSLAIIYVVVHLLSLTRFDPSGYLRIIAQQSYFVTQMIFGMIAGGVYGFWVAKITFPSVFKYVTLWKLWLIVPMIFVLDSTSNHSVAFTQILKTDMWIILLLPFLLSFGSASLITFGLSLLFMTRSADLRRNLDVSK